MIKTNENAVSKSLTPPHRPQEKEVKKKKKKKHKQETSYSTPLR